MQNIFLFLINEDVTRVTRVRKECCHFLQSSGIFVFSKGLWFQFCRLNFSLRFSATFPTKSPPPTMLKIGLALLALVRSAHAGGHPTGGTEYVIVEPHECTRCNNKNSVSTLRLIPVFFWLSLCSFSIVLWTTLAHLLLVPGPTPSNHPIQRSMC